MKIQSIFTHLSSNLSLSPILLIFSGDQVQGPERCLRQWSWRPDCRHQLPLPSLKPCLVPRSLQGPIVRGYSPNNQRRSPPEHLWELHEGAGDGHRTGRWREKRPFHGHRGRGEQQRVGRGLPGAAGSAVWKGARGGQTGRVAFFQTPCHPAQGQEAGVGDPPQVETVLGDPERWAWIWGKRSKWGEQLYTVLLEVESKIVLTFVFKIIQC